MERIGQLCFALLLAGGMAGPAAAAAAGETYVYRVVNAYNKQARGEVRYRVDKVDSEGITMTVTADKPATDLDHTEVYTKEGNWLRHPLDSHGEKVDYVFSSPYPVYVFPLETGKAWSVRVNATVPGVPGVRSVRVDGKVVGPERIRVPAGEFDTIKVERNVYPGDEQHMLHETRVRQADWYSPALGMPVRSETRSQYVDLQNCASSNCMQYGNWDILELVDAGKK